ncbi:hypothetical protein B0H13DRAFT_2649413 [Mycena leptocephala]|nr:hypothetical protein B0H13DRAFT_2649413 [Mycena leptocephala]
MSPTFLRSFLPAASSFARSAVHETLHSLPTQSKILDEAFLSSSPSPRGRSRSLWLPSALDTTSAACRLSPGPSSMPPRHPSHLRPRDMTLRSISCLRGIRLTRTSHSRW